MDAYSNQEKDEIYKMFGAINGNTREGQRLYRDHMGQCPRVDSGAR